MPDPGGIGGVRVGVAFNDPTLEPNPTWTYLTAHDSLVASFNIDRGAESEFVAVETGTATVEINDVDGILDPTNPAGDYYGLIEPLLQIRLEVLNPCNDTWYTRFRGFIEDFDYTIHPSQQVTFLQIRCVGLFAILAAIEMQPGQFGIVPAPAGSEGNIVFEAAADVQTRWDDVMGSAGIPTEFYTAFTGNVSFPRNVYSPSQSALEPLQEAADAELPTVGIMYEDRSGKAVFHGRLAELDPETVAGDAGPSAWDFHHWKAGDEAAVDDSPSDTAHIRSLSFNRGLSFIKNSALCTPLGAADTEIEDGYASDPTSIGQFGIRSWSAENLILDGGNLTGLSAKDECALMAGFIVANFKDPKNRITDISFKSMDPSWTGAAATWALLCQADVSDLLSLTETSASNNLFVDEPFVIRGVHETVEPGTDEFALVTLRLDLVPLPTDAAGIDGE